MLDTFPETLSATASLQPLGYRPMLSLAVFPGQYAGLCAALGVELPASPRQVGAGQSAYLWSGPGAWLALPQNNAAGVFILERAAPFAAITEQGDGHFLIRVTGENARKGLAKLVPVDLHASQFPPDGVALTLAAHIGVKIWREGDDFILACFRSFAHSLYHALREAFLEFEPRWIERS